MQDIERELLAVERHYYRADAVSKNIDTIVTLVLLVALCFVGGALLDLLKFLGEGSGVKYHDFDELAGINPDVVAWLQLDGTRIDGPVVQGKDNFEYLDKSFEGDYYAGGCLFLDERNRKDFGDAYNIIHGHMMEGGVMFGDLRRYEEAEFFQTNKTGKLMTPDWDYDLTVVGVSEINAYDSQVYYPEYVDGYGEPLAELTRCAIHMRAVDIGKNKLLALSTCAGALDQNRIVVFLRMKKGGRH